LIGGFVLIAQTGLELTPGTVCSVVSLSSILLVTAEGSGSPPAEFPLAQVTSFEITNHGAVKGNGEFIGHEFDFLRSSDGSLVAHSLNRIRSRPTIGTTLSLDTSVAHFTFATNLYTPAQLKNLLVPIQELIKQSKKGSDTGPSVVTTSASSAIDVSEPDAPVLARPMIGAALHDTPRPADVSMQTAAVTSAVAADAADKDLADQLQRLTEMHQSGSVGDGDFEITRARLLETWVRHQP
jgi:hypothetical protein